MNRPTGGSAPVDTGNHGGSAMESTSKEKKSLDSRRRKKWAFLTIGFVVVTGIVPVFIYLKYIETHVSTDDAYIDGHIHMIASKIPGTVKALLITDNQHVKKGDLLLEIDPADYDVQAQEARASHQQEIKRLTELRNSAQTVKKQLEETLASLKAARADLELQKSNLELAKKEFERAESLVRSGYISKEEHDQKKAAYEVSIAQVKSASDNVNKAEASVRTQQAAIRQAESAIPTQEALIRQRGAALKGADLNVSYTKIYAPAEGYVTNRSVEVGNQVQVSQPLDIRDIWITANYKETDLTNVKPGQKVRIKVDTYPGKVFHGKVNSIMAGTGSVFSLFPPENATGNFVKVVQRIPVKIVLDENTDPGHLLRVGMSVVPTILIGTE
jgi:membrane fusion protein (multidrug efflux system)